MDKIKNFIIKTKGKIALAIVPYSNTKILKLNLQNYISSEDLHIPADLNDLATSNYNKYFNRF